ncbi:MAG TPA: hypothetical protein VH163_02330 [Gemmatimonadales bacterium]|nr:hypothetical protein [Gemmatimonadales bacterium]
MNTGAAGGGAGAAIGIGAGGGMGTGGAGAAAAASVGVGAAVAGWVPFEETGNTFEHTEQRARTPPAGTFAGSTR